MPNQQLIDVDSVNPMKRREFLTFCISIISFSLFVISFASFIFFYWVSPLIMDSPCSCPPSGFVSGSVIKEILNSTLHSAGYYDCSMFGCALSYYIFPTDLAAISIFLFIVGIITLGLRFLFLKRGSPTHL